MFVGLRGNDAVLKINDNGKEVLWPKSNLPVGINEGDYLNFLISESDSDSSKRKQLAKDILNEILNVK